MRLLSVCGVLLVAVIFSLEGSPQEVTSNSASDPPFESKQSGAKKASTESVPSEEESKLYGGNHSEEPTDKKEAQNLGVMYKNQTLPYGPQARSSKGSTTNPQDLWKEFFHSLYVDRYGRGVKTQTALSAINVGNLAVLGIVVLGGLALIAPIIFPEFKKRSMARSFGFIDEKLGLQKYLTSGLVGFSESVMGWVEKSVDDLPNFPRLDAQECMKRCICEAHNQPKKYGITGLFLQLLFPPYTETEEPSRIVSKYQLAARYGRTETANCAQQYDGCLVNFLDMIQGVINLVF